MEYNTQQSGRIIECPHCKANMQLPAPAARPIIEAQANSIAGTTIFCTYILSVIMPFAGFFAGIYLMTKKESGHGLTCIALSIIFNALLVWLFMELG